MRKLPSRALVREELTEARRLAKLMRAAWRDNRPPRPSWFGAFGEDSVIVPPARITNGDCIEIGDGVRILEHSWLSVVRAVEGFVPRLVISDGCRIGRFANVACVGEVVFEPNVLTADRIFVGDTYHEYQDTTRPVIVQPMARPQPVVIGEGSFLGVGSMVLHGVSIGKGSYVGAGAVVTESVPPHSVVGGNPARVLSHWDADAEAWLRRS
jgi:acetyltransferase-like isoleucine patch superfamily enzyme